jgi:16S rRNA (cytosine967-C5)-methyltransferase
MLQARPARTEREPKGSPARLAAVRALVASEEGEHVEEALARFAPPRADDRAHAWHLALGVLRRRSWLDAALREVVRQPLSELDPPVRAVLRIGAFELLVGGTPPHAALNEAVEVSRDAGVGRASGLVNAALRRVQAPSQLTPAERAGLPGWLWGAWVDRLGEAEAMTWARSCQEPPPLVLAVRDPGGVDALHAALAASGIRAEPARALGAVVPQTLRVVGRVAAEGDEPGRPGRVDAFPGFAEGSFWVQDAASAAMTDLVPADAQRVLDAAAAPGGKTLRLAARGASVTSVDLDPRRLELLRTSLLRTKLRADVLAHDWLQGPAPELGTFDAVLLDAPCTGLGTLRRHPEIKWARGPMDPDASADRQLAIARAVLAHVRPGGCLVYVVCSTEPEEGEDVVRALLKAFPTLTLEEERCTTPRASYDDGEDGFYGARLRWGAPPA